MKVQEFNKTSATIQWQPPKDTGGVPLTSYIIEKREALRATWSKADKIDADQTVYTAKNLTEGSEYFFRVAAENKAGVGPFLEMDKPVKAKSPFGVPDQPDSLHIKNIKKNSLTLEWTPPKYDGGARIKKYIVYIKKEGDNWEKETSTDSYKTNYDITGLKPEKDYSFGVAAENEIGVGEKAETDKPIKLSKPINPPSPPEGPMVVSEIQKKSCKVGWKAPEHDGGSPITRYIVEKREQWKTTWTHVDNVSANKLFCDLPNLQEGKEISIRVMAENIAGQSKPLESETSVVPKSPYSAPSAPESLTVEDITESSVDLKWTPPAKDGGLPIKGYTLERRDKRYGSYVKVATTKTLSYTVENLRLGSEYFFRVLAENDEGMGPAYVVTVGPPGKPEGPLKVSEITRDSATLEWKPPTDDGGSTITGYVIEKKETLRTSWTPGVVDGQTLNYKAKKLVVNNEYDFRIVAINAEGEGPPLEAKQTIKLEQKQEPPSAPEEPLEVKNVTKNSATVSWKPSTKDNGSPITHYVIEKKDAWKTSWSKVDRVKASQNSVDIKNLTEGNSYHVRVMAENSAGLSEPLQTDIDEPIVPKSPYKVPGKPEGPMQIVETDSTSATIRWQPPESDGGLPIKRYIVERRDVKRQAWIKVDAVRGNQLTCHIDKLIEGTNYMFQVSAENDEGVGKPLESDGPVQIRRKAGKSFIICEEYLFRVSAKNAIGRSKPVTMESPVKPMRPMGKSTISLDMLQTLKTSNLSFFLWNCFCLSGLKYEVRSFEAIVTFATGYLFGFAFLFLEVPGAPRGPLTASDIQRDSMTLSWQTPLDTGGSPITGYIVDKLDSQRGGWVRACKVGPNINSCKISGLTEGHDYNFRVYSENKMGVGQPLDMKNMVKAKNKPSEPEKLKVTEVLDDAVFIEWSPPAQTGGLDLIGYVVERREAGSSQWQRIGHTEDTKFKCRNLLEGRSYNFRVFAENAEGLSEPVTLKKSVMPERQLGK
ncbi:hypothetical protein LOTGIDRAFT_141638 [Lottia gigantea]|uniref:Fibronectin type-III domain-containing protein n=1 Tax=Lottia gigantea TaxID=225164 RepID=V4A744_LOTGI|nr:hypothetical protein LOTGIDRAFT_141638 [Lottia gigantea]ESO99758.1 hypothetical protein LOTGIDRAFT_141638 [Lottia gigantea]